MHGITSPRKRTANYLRSYAHTCQSTRHHYGQLSALALNNDGVLLHLLSVDAGVVSLPDRPARVCCALTKLGSPPTAADAAVSEFIASLTVLTAWLKLTDDARDGGTFAAPAARLALSTFAGRFERMFDYFTTLDPAFRAQLTSILAEQARVEALPAGMVTLDDLAAPTAEGYGYVFGLLSVGWARPEDAEALRAVGREVGAATLLFDAASDHAEDRRRGVWNPLADHSQVGLAFWEAKRHLGRAAAVAAGRWGESSLGAALLRSANETLVLDASGRPAKEASLLEESRLPGCVPGGTAMAALGLAPTPLVAEMTNQEAQCVFLGVCGGITVFCSNACLKNMGCKSRKITHDSNGEPVVTEVGPYGF